MKLYAICLVKNEPDIIEHSLNSALEWAEKIIVFDTGSTDETWELVNHMRSPKIIPYKQEIAPYSDGLRADIFNGFKHEMEPGDWWVVQDADEVYEEDPRLFLKKNKGFFHYVSGRKIDFCFDLAAIDRLSFADAFKDNLHLFDRHSPDAWSEPRLIRHRKNLEWTREGIWPRKMGVDCLQQIKIRHYPLRSPQQIRQRWLTRKDVPKKEHTAHWEAADWREYYGGKADSQLRVDPGQDVLKQSKSQTLIAKTPQSVF